MKKNTITYFFCFLISFSSGQLWGQTDSAKIKNKPYLELRGGLGIPFGISDDNVSEFQLRAKTGPEVAILAEVPIIKLPIGIAMQTGFGVNVNNGSYNYLPYAYSFGGSSALKFNGNYYEISFLAGPYYSLRATKQLSINFRILCGALMFRNPEVWYSYRYNGMTGHSTDTTDEKAANKVAFAYNIGIGLRYRPAKRFSFSFNADFLKAYSHGVLETTTQSTQVIDIINPPDISTQHQTTYSDLKVPLLNITLGIGYYLGK